MSDRWYKPTRTPHAMPPLRAYVRVVWEGRQFVARREIDPRSKRMCWAVMRSSTEFEYWPPKRGWPRGVRWGKVARTETFAPEPSLYQPLDPSDTIWQIFPLPDPEPPAFGGKFAPLVEHPTPSPPAPEEMREDWWRDPGLVTYSDAPHIGRSEAEGRVMRAILTDGLRPWKPRTAPASGWPKAFQDADERCSASTFDPTPRDVSDSIIAMGWFAALDPPEMRRGAIRSTYTEPQLLLILRAQDPPFTWREIEILLGRPEKVARRRYRDATEAIMRAANGDQVFDHIPQRDRAAELRARNRRAKRAAAYD